MKSGLPLRGSEHWPSWATRPSRFELSVLYVLLGVHLILGTDAAIPSGWVMFAGLSLFGVGLWSCGRLALVTLKWRMDRVTKVRCGELGGILLLLVLVHATNLGVMVRLYFSEQSLIDELRMVSGDRPLRNGNIPRGLFTVQNTFATMEGETRVVWLETVSGSRLFGNHSMWGGLRIARTAPCLKQVRQRSVISMDLGASGDMICRWFDLDNRRLSDP